MGRKLPARSKSTPTPRTGGLAGALFTNTQQRVLALLFGQPGRSYYASELIGLAGAGSGAVQRELGRLADAGLVTVRPVGNQKYYQANPDSPLFAELCGIVQKTVGLAEPLRKALQPLAGKITAAFVYGSVAKREDTATSDIDLMIVGDVSFADVIGVLSQAQEVLHREINPTVYPPGEFGTKAGEVPFLARVLADKKIFVIGSEDDIGKIVSHQDA